MSLREEMHSLVEGIVSASDTRRAGLLSLKRGVAGQREEGRRYLHELHLVHATMAQELRAGLGKVRLGLSQEEAQRRSGVQGWIGEIAGDRGAAQREWQNMAATPQEKRAGGEGVSSIGDRVYRQLANQPDGLPLAEIERQFGMSRFEAARATKELVKSGKVEKRDLRYFAL